MKLKYFALSTLLILLLLSACSAFKAPVSSIEPTAEATIRAAAQPIAENLLQSFNNNDYQGVLRDMDATMVSAFTQDSIQPASVENCDQLWCLSKRHTHGSHVAARLLFGAFRLQVRKRIFHHAPGIGDTSPLPYFRVMVPRHEIVY